QVSAEYQDYLSRYGQDNDTYYDIKIKASQLLLSHVEDTFVTPVFNGSASLRDAAGQMIENVTKSVNRRETIDDAYMDKLYEDVTSLYRLQSTMQTSSDKKDLGALPPMAAALLSGLAITWALIGVYVVREALKNRKKRQNHH
ncbi:MAG: ABC transporter substrate-binding protein, partial [Acetatifactor sp.]|nr:ABC transporter substrate-binding protein [Acetatifactor sp.]